MKFINATVVFLASLASSSARPLASHSAAFLAANPNVFAVRQFGKTALNATGGKVSVPVRGGEELMSEKAHGTSEKPVQKELRWGCDVATADRICNFNRHYAEHSGYWQTTKYLEEVPKTEPTEYYDSVTGNLLFTAPVGRSMDDYLKESMSHGWPSFRDEEVNWEYVRVLDNGECVSTTGTHLGHNLPDAKGNRYCINLVCVAGKPQ